VVQHKQGLQVNLNDESGMYESDRREVKK
jgi:hypothetical protein